ncbi:MAG TPA: hypothetical protein VFA23_17085 [Dongiaceae bacterium]|nr:hypothetical protein [Dongiaceae bacterium]
MPHLAPELARVGFVLVALALFAVSSWQVRRAIRTSRARIRFSAALRERNASIFWFNLGSSLLAAGLGSFLLATGL